jgi:demethylmenaquinone methyltransferase/2-methoxy-6-polyprenyl-1,4-benzoquinol methylase
VSFQDSNAVYKVLSKFYDLFDWIFLLGGEGNPRSGLLEVIGNTPAEVLDVCVGTAASAILLASQHDQNRIVGIDISEDMLAVARRKIAQRKLTNLDAMNMSAEAMQFEDNRFDLVMVSFALHEFDRDFRERVFQEVARVLKPGGRFCVIDFARQENIRNRIFMRLWSRIEPSCFADFLALDWHRQLAPYGLCIEGEKAYSFSKLYVLRKT